jgi:hypothetical protein
VNFSWQRHGIHYTDAPTVRQGASGDSLPEKQIGLTIPPNVLA